LALTAHAAGEYVSIDLWSIVDFIQPWIPWQHQNRFLATYVEKGWTKTDRWATLQRIRAPAASADREVATAPLAPFLKKHRRTTQDLPDRIEQRAQMSASSTETATDLYLSR
jgi:hypothetical protein